MGHFAQFGLVALDLANTWDEYLDDPERLPDVAALRRFCDELEEAEAAAQVGEDDLVAVRAVRSRLRAVLAAEPRERAPALARWAAELPVRAQIVAADGLPELRLTAAEHASPADRLAVRAVRELLDIAGSGDWERLRLCAASPCRDAFVDRSRPGRRQFCSTRCANRAHAAASRARHRA
ncbi:putative RNA-binding Zn ribbon-like protein [Nonomuraea muscovyensis]|uniref:Putative RNA-binding Zn ribbon-like protein n=1 Tax=Nonomuraea muscovyensis TaxID=1124761 RepID=A0A7X0CBB9_9ACTN|nr:CGNR zinc finger domain-containing protein [Nonomuraea muscovyensis]MBB6350985.1 putative RNA-binding Zn ribbon-like protein [Nonomuraea muscovyensis]